MTAAWNNHLTQQVYIRQYYISKILTIIVYYILILY